MKCWAGYDVIKLARLRNIMISEYVLYCLLTGPNVVQVHRHDVITIPALLCHMTILMEYICHSIVLESLWIRLIC